MEPEKVILGIDTSCYTTSLAVMNAKGELLRDERKILSVKKGNCGLAQSEMVFQHTRNLPELFDNFFWENYQVTAVAVTNQPRPLPDSYMPAFLTGLGLGRNLAKVLNVPLYTLSHQENHLLAGLWSAQGPASDKFIMLHASGGTTDFLLATKNARGHFALKTIGASLDLHAGQFIDRVGVALGLQFPCGPFLEKLANTAQESIELPIWTKAGNISFSGPCTKATRLASGGAKQAELALGTERAIGKTFAKALTYLCEFNEVKDVLLVGGVSANALIGKIVTQELTKKDNRVFIPKPHYCGDGAVGAAFYGVNQLRENNDNR